MSEIPSSLADAERNKSKKSSQQHENHQATCQIGGKGTVRRRRIRKSKVKYSNQNETFQHNLKTNFLNKYKLKDEGKLNSFSFIYDDGTVRSFTTTQNTEIKFSANYEKHFYHMNSNSAPTASLKTHSLTSTITTTDVILQDFNENIANRIEVYALIGKHKFFLIIR
jgi:hypothetical protein